VTRLRYAFFVGLALLALACGPSGPLKASALQLGKSLNSDDSVGTIASRFAPDDTIYAAVLTDAPGAGTIKARWTYRGAVVNQEEKKVSYRDAAATEFHIHYAGGAPVGDYRVEIEIDGKPAFTRDFKVER
jgi:hypothetical protein